MVFALLVLGAAAAPDYAAYEYYSNPWDCVGLKDYAGAVRVSPAGELVLPGDRRIAVEAGNPPRHFGGALRYLEEGFLPIVCLARDDGTTLARALNPRRPGPEFFTQDVATVRIFASPIDPASVAQWEGPAETQTFLLHLHVEAPKKMRVALRMEGFGKLEGEMAVKNVVVVRSGDADVLGIDGTLASITSECIECEISEKVPLEVVVAVGPLPRPNKLGEPGFGASALTGCRTFWTSFLARGARLSIAQKKAAEDRSAKAYGGWGRSAQRSDPLKKVTDAWNTAIIGNFIARDGHTLKPGEGFYDNFYLRDGAYQLRSLLVAGFAKELAGSIEDILAVQAADGNFGSQRGELDGNGQAVWALWSYYAFTRDRAMLTRVWPAVKKSCAWVAEARKKEGGPFKGILPKSLADGEFLWDGSCHIVGYDLWALRGLDCAALMGRELGEDVSAILTEREDYARCVDAALAQGGFSWFPPSYEGKGTHWGNLTALYPMPVVPRDDPRVEATMVQARTTFEEGTIRWCPDTQRAIHPYMSTYVTQTALLRGDQVRAIVDFTELLCHSSATNAFPEGAYYETRTAWGNTIPHIWGASQYMLLLRNMLVREEGNELHLCSAVPGAWYAGGGVRLEKMPTAFGPVSLAAAQPPGGRQLEFAIELPADAGLARVVLHLPQGCGAKEVTTPKGATVAVRNDAAVLAPESGKYTVVCDGIPYQWRFEARARTYLSKKQEKLYPVTGLIPLPWTVARENALCLDLRSVAVTDQHAAPFGIDTKGALVFKGVPTGVVTALGVPFNVIDPATNGGRGLVVLRSKNTAASFPERIEVPVHAVGKAVFFLGQVGGWVPEGTGGAEAGCYELLYADGEKTRVPLVIGATIDDWLQAPMATQANLALRGATGHLNAIAVPLLPKKLAKIAFVSSNTAVAPVLAAITIER